MDEAGAVGAAAAVKAAAAGVGAGAAMMGRAAVAVGMVATASKVHKILLEPCTEHRRGPEIDYWAFRSVQDRRGDRGGGRRRGTPACVDADSAAGAAVTVDEATTAATVPTQLEPSMQGSGLQLSIGAVAAVVATCIATTMRAMGGRQASALSVLAASGRERPPAARRLTL